MADQSRGVDLPPRTKVRIPGRRWQNGCETDTGDVWLLVHPWREVGTREHWYGSPISGQRARYVSVISRYAAGQIRAYWLDMQGRLWLDSPCYTRHWSEMDAEVAAALGGTVVPYGFAGMSAQVVYDEGVVEAARAEAR